MTEIATGALVRHVSLGVGKVVAVEPTAVHVFFPDSEKLEAAKLRWPAAGALLTREGVPPDSWLEGLTSFALDPVSGRYALARNFLSHEEAIADFLTEHPQAFAGATAARGKPERATRWRAARAEWASAFGDGEGERLAKEGDLGELSRRALRVAGQVSGMPGTIEQEVLQEALEPGDVVASFFDALFALVAAASATRPRLDKLFAASAALGVEPEFAWPMATLFPFLADPATHMLLVPKQTCAAATRLGCDLRFKPSPNATTYAALRNFCAALLAKLGPAGARDFIDVEPLLYSTGIRRPPPRKR